jgi:hypothetical protein
VELGHLYAFKRRTRRQSPRVAFFSELERQLLPSEQAELQRAFMVSAWWLLLAFWLGGCLGVLLAGLLAVSHDSASEDEEAPARRRLREQR